MARLLEHLKPFLANQLSIPFAYGQSDCATWVSDWVLNMTGIDPAVTLRGTYNTELGCAKILNRHKGLVAIMHRYMMGSTVMYMVTVPFHGDVAVIRLQVPMEIDPIGYIDVAALRTKDGWAYKPAHGGIAIIKEHVTVLGLWRIKPSAMDAYFQEQKEAVCLQ